MRLRDLSLASASQRLLLWAGSLLLLALLGAAVASEIRSERARAEAAAVRENQNRAIAYEQFVTRTFEAAELAAIHLATHYAGSFEAGSVPRRLDDPIARNPLFGGVVVADAQGDVGWSTLRKVHLRNIAHRRGFRALRDSRSRRMLFVSDPTLSPSLGRPVVPFARAIRGADGSFLGTVNVLIPVEALVAFNQSAQLRPLDLISVFRLDGMTLARRTGGRVTWGENLAGKLVMQRQLAEPNGWYLGPNSVDGTLRYFSQRRIARYGIFSTTGVGHSDVMAPVRESARQDWVAFALLAAAVLSFTALLSWSLGRRDRVVAALARSNVRLREAQRLGKIGDWTFDPQTERLTWSPQLCEMVGRDPADNVLTEEEALDYLAPASRAELLATIQACETDPNRGAHECEVLTLPAAKGERWLRIRVTPLPGDPQRLFAIVQDVSAEKRHQQLRDEIAQIARVESMNMVGATAVHELSQPLTAASNYVAAAKALAAREAPGDAALVVERLEEASRQLGFTRNMVQRVRDMVTDRADSVPGASVRDIVEDAVALLWLAAPGWQGDVDQRLDVATARVAADQIQVQQVLLNLLRNACQAAAHSGAPHVVLSGRLHSADSVVFAVEDNGPGIPAGVGDIFSPFASTKRDGLGLGLAVSRAIVQSYGGSMWIDSRHAPGARICFTLPLEK